MNQFFPHDTRQPNGETWAKSLRESLDAPTVRDYSDWCESRGWCEWAEWLRLHVELELWRQDDATESLSFDGINRHAAIRARLRELLVGPMEQCLKCALTRESTKLLKRNGLYDSSAASILTAASILAASTGCSACNGSGVVQPKVANAEAWFGVPGLNTKPNANDTLGVFCVTPGTLGPPLFACTFRFGFPVIRINMSEWWADGSKKRCMSCGMENGPVRETWAAICCDQEKRPWHGYHRILTKQWPVIAGVRTDREPNNHGIGKKPWCWSFVGSTTLPEPHWLPLEFGKYFSEAHWSERSSLGAVDYPSREAADADLERVLLAMAYGTKEVTV